MGYSLWARIGISDEVVGLFPQTYTTRSGPSRVLKRSGRRNQEGWGLKSPGRFVQYDDASGGGSAARFFYTSKASKAERAGSKHPIIKPVDLIRWLVRLVTPPGGLVLDLFAGSGTTGEATLGEGMDAILVEKEKTYVKDAERRIAKNRPIWRL